MPKNRPVDEGFKLHSLGHYEVNIMLNAQVNGWDRLKIAADDQAYYVRPLSGNQKIITVNRDWRLICICAVEQGSACANVEIGNKLRRFDIELYQENDKFCVALTRQISPEIEWE